MASPTDGSSAALTAPKQRTLFGHPVGLYVLFLTEMWERFSYYGMRSLLILYMLNYFKWTQENASTVYKWYTSLVYLTPLLGGYLADRYLGNKRAVIIGALLMAIGHFLMAFEAYSVFFTALFFLIMGNGFFKPNMTTQVGRLYRQNDGRRDGAYTIFYMGINLGAFLAPLVCGWLAANTMGEYHSGFTAAGIGMLLGLVIYVVGSRWVIEINPDARGEATATAHGVPEAVERGREKPPEPSRAISEEVAARTPSVLGRVNRLAPAIMVVLGALLTGAAVILGLVRLAAWSWGEAVPFLHNLTLDGAITNNNLPTIGIVGICALACAWILGQVRNGVRDRVLAIYVLGVFVVFFWAAFEQAGNALNLWADKTTDRYLTKAPAGPPALFPEIKDDKTQEEQAREEKGVFDRIVHMFQMKPAAKEGDKPSTSEERIDTLNPVPTPWFQSINALAIFILAPLFAALWTTLARRGLNPSIPTKMALGLVFMCLSMAVMVASAKQEDRPLRVPLAHLPKEIELNDKNQLCENKEGELVPYHAGRLKYLDGQLEMTGVLPDIDAYRMIRDTAPKSYKEAAKKLQEKSEAARDSSIRVSVRLEKLPPSLDIKNIAGLGEKSVFYDPASHSLVALRKLKDRDVKALLLAGGDREFRVGARRLFEESVAFRVSSWWLFWCYILATIGELCLSPVGLSMVSKLAPAKFATMLMGLWLVTNFLANFVAGAFGEIWGKVAPTDYFVIFLVALGIAAVVLFLLVRKLVAMMHGVS